MAPLARHRLSPADTGPALRALRAWTPSDAPAGSLHPGDVGWLLRRDDATVFLWTDARTSTHAAAPTDARTSAHAAARTDTQISARADGVATTAAPVAVGFLDGPVLRVTAAPDADLGALAADAEDLLVPGNDATDGLPVPGWEPDTEEPWLVFSWTPEPVSSRAVEVTESDTADRALVHRAAFTGSTLTADHWRTMKKSPAGHLAVETLVRTPAGEPAAAATGWFGGAGRCGLLEPVGTHADHRGHGYGRDAVRGACAALADRGASAVAVLTPASNEAAVALYTSAGFTVVRENHDWTRPGRG
ncbi:GNAT family N-acetyltransferase [Streptomyces sp. DH18]|uniref:GNAT family N-acetyltransferase n=1 Tax=Streptomyces sp. DH18 TaxID=3040126 RepID=UPI0024420082|nr:GNAT family N-acetyltransferase [Streptomyces sp. DH18]MDG9683396.1 GNAT family N-acetyltransferase [Streptomyces sp. DH18]